MAGGQPAHGLQAEQSSLAYRCRHDHAFARAVDGKPRYVFPRRDCALLPIPNTTVEMLARLLTERLKAEIDKMGGRGVKAIEMEVEENFGQSAVYRVTYQ